MKGGTGKSTIATNLAVWLTKRGRDVLLVDTDGDGEEGTATRFCYVRIERLRQQQQLLDFTAVQLAGQALYTQIIRQKSKYSDIVIDVGARETTSQRAAWAAADVILVPIQPRDFDAWSLGRSEKLIQEIRAARADSSIRAYTFLSRADPNGPENRDCEAFLQESKHLTYLDVRVSDLKAICRAGAQGMGISEYKPVDRKAIRQIDQLFTLLIENKAHIPNYADATAPKG
jgi:chromosome partitioning protein